MWVLKSSPFVSFSIDSILCNGVFKHCIRCVDGKLYVRSCIYDGKACIQILNSTGKSVFFKSHLLGLEDFVVIFPADFKVIESEVLFPLSCGLYHSNLDFSGRLALEAFFCEFVMD